MDLSIERVGEMSVEDGVCKILFMEQAHFDITGTRCKPEFEEGLDTMRIHFWEVEPLQQRLWDVTGVDRSLFIFWEIIDPADG